MAAAKKVKGAAEPAPFLPKLLEEMFALSIEQGAGIHRKLKSGLHVKVAQRGGRRQIILWRDGERLPSRKECEVIARDAGFTQPQYRSWKCKESDDAFLLSESPKVAPADVDAAPPVLTPEEVKKAEQAAKDAQEKAQAQLLRGVLHLIQLRYAFMNRWFRYGHVVEARWSAIERMSLDDLKAECSGPWFTSNARLVWPFGLLLSLRRHTARALPQRAASVTARRKRRSAA